MNRRQFVLAAGMPALPAAGRPPYRVAIIGHTGRGNFGHDWDVAWQRVTGARVVAVADPDEAGRARAASRAGGKAYKDYRAMIKAEKPDIVTIATRHTDQRLEMASAATEAGAHLLMEKPFAGSLPDADRIYEMTRSRKLRVQVGHAARLSPVVKRAKQLIDSGELGDMLEVRARGKEDRRAGGEDMIVLGTHCFDLMRQFLGDPEFVSAQVLTGGRPAAPADVRQATEPVGLIAGDQIDAMFRFPTGIPAYFASKRTSGAGGSRFGVWFLCSQGGLFVSLGHRRGAAWINRSSNWTRSADSSGWAPFGGDWPEKEGEWNVANYAMATDLAEAIEKRREPACGAADGRWTIEMIAGIYRSHIEDKPVKLPLANRGDPLVEWRKS